MKTSLLHSSSSEILHGDGNFQKEENTSEDFLFLEITPGRILTTTSGVCDMEIMSKVVLSPFLL